MHIIIDFKNDTAQDLINQYLTEHSCTVLETFSAFDKVYLVTAEVLPPVTSIVESVQDDDALDIKPLAYPKIEGEAFPNVEFSSSNSNDWWKMAVVSAPKYLAETQVYQRRGNCAVIYLMDSGIDLTHPEFEFATVSNLWTFNNDFTDVNSHGTALASLMCGKTCSLADPEVKSVKIWHDGVQTKLSHFLSAFDAIYNDLPNIQNKLAIVNMSWGVTKNTYLENKIKVLLDNGVVMVASAGNSGEVIDNVTPAAMLEVFTVGAYDQTFSPCDFSNYTGSVPTTTGTTNFGELDGWAPGSNLRLAMPGGSYGIGAGTSMAAAIHSAAIAYNSHMLQLPNGSFPLTALKDLFAATISLGKKDYLDLSDPKYQSSKNFITVYYGEPDGYNQIDFEKPTAFVINVESGKSVEVLLALNFIFSSVTLADALPTGFVQNGLWISGSKTVDELLTFETVATCVNNFGVQSQLPFTLRVVPSQQLANYDMSVPSALDYVDNFELNPINKN